MSKRKYSFDELSNTQLEELISTFVRGKLNQELAREFYLDCLTCESVAEKHLLSVSTVVRHVKDIGKVISENKKVME